MKIDLIPIKLFFSLQKTGEHRNATPITLGIVSECGKFSFYAEFTDFDRGDNALYVQEKILPVLRFTKLADENTVQNDVVTNMTVCGSRHFVAEKLEYWLTTIYHNDLVDFWGDSITYDWILLCELLDKRQAKPLLLSINSDRLTVDEVERFKQEFIRWQKSNPQPLLVVNSAEDISIEHSTRIGFEPNLPDNILSHPKDILTLFSLVGLSPQREAYMGIINHKEMKYDSLYTANLIKKCYFKLINQIGTRG